MQVLNKSAFLATPLHHKTTIISSSRRKLTFFLQCSSKPLSKSFTDDLSTAPPPTATVITNNNNNTNSTLLNNTLTKPALAAILALSLAAATPSISHAATDFLQLSTPGAAFIPGLVGDDPFREGLLSGFLLIFFSEIGDKTFFIALLLALKQPKSLVFTGTFGALAVMTVISVGLGRFIHKLDELLPASPLPLDDVFATALLIWFGVTTLLAAKDADETAIEEKEEAQEVVEGFGADAAMLSLLGSTFALVFAAEWGDKSFLATIALAAASSPVGVVGGAIAGHGVATAIAVLGGSYLGRYLSEKVVQYIGGSLFLVFAAATIFDIVTAAD